MNVLIKSLKTFFTFLLLGMYLLVPSTAHARTLELSISPRTYDVISMKDQTISLTIKVVNTGDPTIAKLKVYKFYPLDSAGTIDFTQVPQSAGLNFSIENASISLDSPFLFQKNTSYSFNLKITVSGAAREGEIPIAIAIESEDPSQFYTTSQLTVEGSVSALIYLSISEKGAQIREPKITVFSLPGAGFPGPVTLFDKFVLIPSKKSIPVILNVANTGTYSTALGGALYFEPYFSKAKDWTDSKLESLEEKSLEDTSKQTPNMFAFGKIRVAGGTQNSLITPYSKSNNLSSIPGKMVGVFRLTAVVRTNSITSPVLTQEKIIVIFPYYSLMIIAALIGSVLIAASLRKKTR